ncbi:MAG: hypothetical protein F6K24_13510 [Okeania sp. SIO2D1]|nr:hypothetical protein [Okeania sp. SIO2D1]
MNKVIVALVKRVYDINLNYLGVRSQETGDNPPLTPPRRGREEGKGKMWREIISNPVASV